MPHTFSLADSAVGQALVAAAGQHPRLPLGAMSDFGRVGTRALVPATGASYRRLGLPRLEAYEGAGHC